MQWPNWFLNLLIGNSNPTFEYFIGAVMRVKQKNFLFLLLEENGA